MDGLIQARRLDPDRFLGVTLVNDNVSVGSSPRRIRLNNAAAALQTLYSVGRMSRAELARRLGLNRSSSGQIAAELTQCGLVQEVEVAGGVRAIQSRAGRPGILLELVADAAFFVGIEIGVEHITTVVMDFRGCVRVSRKQPFDAPSAPVDQAVSLAVNTVFDAMDKLMIERCQGVGISAPMHIRSDGTVELAPLIGWRNISLVQIAAAALPAELPIMIENDANAFAIGDSYKHGPSGVTLYLLMETGVGGGIMIDGKLFRGGHGLAGEIGHTLVPGSGGQSLESLIGSETILERYRAATGNPDTSLEDFLAGVRDREPDAVTIAEEWSRHLAFALVQACRLIDPDRVVLGGAVALIYPMVAARVAAHMRAGQTLAFPVPRIVVDEDAENGSAYGAACMLHQRFLSFENDALVGNEGAVAKPAGGSGLSSLSSESAL